MIKIFPCLYRKRQFFRFPPPSMQSAWPGQCYTCYRQAKVAAGTGIGKQSRMWNPTTNLLTTKLRINDFSRIDICYNNGNH
jgi:hypothetical protein